MSACCETSSNNLRVRRGTGSVVAAKGDSTDLATCGDETVLVRKVDIAWVLLSRVYPAVPDRDSLEREVGQMRRLKDRVGWRMMKLSQTSGSFSDRQVKKCD